MGGPQNRWLLFIKCFAWNQYIDVHIHDYIYIYKYMISWIVLRREVERLHGEQRPVPDPTRQNCCFLQGDVGHVGQHDNFFGILSFWKSLSICHCGVGPLNPLPRSCAAASGARNNDFAEIRQPGVWHILFIHLSSVKPFGLPRPGHVGLVPQQLSQRLSV